MAANVLLVTSNVDGSKRPARDRAAVLRRHDRAEGEIDAGLDPMDTEADPQRQALMRADADAEAERLARERIRNTRTSLEKYRQLEVAEKEAEAVARIRAETERSLATQEEARAEAERAHELAAIVRTQAENEAAHQARRHAEAEEAARSHAEARLAAERAAEIAVADRLAAAQRLASERKARRRTEFEAAKVRCSRLALLLAAVRYASPLAVATVAMLIGCAIGAWLALSGRLEPLQGSAMPENDAAGVDVRLKLEHKIPRVNR